MTGAISQNGFYTASLGVMFHICAAFLTIAILWSSWAMAHDNAGIFFYGPAPSPAQIENLAKGATVSSAAQANTTSIRVEWPDVSITINIDPNWNRDLQLSGIRGWLSQFPKNERSSKQVVSFLSELDRTTTSYGSIISPSYDKAGKAATLLKQLLGSSGGFFFSHQSFYNAKGERIAGLPGDPAILGPK